MISDVLKNIAAATNKGEALILPSEWAEKNVTLSREVSAIPGKFSYKHIPYMREIVDTFYPYNDAKIIVVMASAQIGKTQGLIVNALLYMINFCPGNTLSLSANDKLSEEMIEGRLDPAIQSCGMQHLIRPNTIRKRNQRTGDTSSSKEYPGGRLYAGGMKGIDKLARQRSIKYGFFDDWDAAAISHKEEGNLFSLLQKRFNTFKNEMKEYFISTPKTKPSNIELLYEMGDQRKWFVPCPCCGVYIELVWVDDEFRNHGIVYELNDTGKLIKDSVGYKCQECGDIFKESHKYDMNLKGQWRPTAEPDEPGMVSYHISSLYAASWMFGWEKFVYEWLSIFKDGNESISKKKAFFNQVLGIAWEEKSEEIKENALIKNVRDYEINTIPNDLSISDGNGEIILITCSCDLNGILDDARLDYDIWAHSENGSIYSIDQGSIGTRFSYNKNNDNRTKFSYKNESENSVWEIFYHQIMNRQYTRDSDGELIYIHIIGIDIGWYTQQAYKFIEAYKHEGTVLIGVKGGSSAKYKKMDSNLALYKRGKERNDIYILEVDLIKDQLAAMINLECKEGRPQPEGFMNFPFPVGNKYSAKGYFSQFEAEHKIIQLNDDGEQVGWMWDKKKTSNQNHYFDTGVYNLGCRMIFARMFCEENGYKNATWADFVTLMRSYADG